VGYKPGRFSFNVSGGRCEACQGEGQRPHRNATSCRIVYVVCEVCGGRRYNHETLSVKYKGHSIADLLETPVADALQDPREHPAGQTESCKPWSTWASGYVHLGQSAVTLSVAKRSASSWPRLSKRQTGRPSTCSRATTGLHFDDVKKLLDVLHRLTDLGTPSSSSSTNWT